MTLAPETIEKLAAPLDPARVQKREGSGGRQLSYLEGHDVVRAANNIFGVGAWGYRVHDLTLLGEEPTENSQGRKGFRVAYRATVNARVGETEYADVGYGDAVEYTGSRLTPHELASKEAVTDALKRCMKNLGDQFGLCLYDKTAPEHRGANGGQRVSAPAAAGGGASAAAPPTSGLAGDVVCPLGKNKGAQIKAMARNSLKWYAGEEFNPTREDGIEFKQAVLAYLADENAPVPAPPEDFPF